MVVALLIGGIPFPYSFSLLSSFVLAIPLFVLPLTIFLRKLMAAKAEEATWISRKYASMLETIKRNSNAELDEGLKSDFATIRQIQQDL